MPPLSKAWQNASKVDMAEDGPPLAVLFIPTLVGYFVTTVVIGLIVEAIGITEVGDGVVLGIVLGIGFGAVSALVTQVYERKGSNYWLINGINAVIAYVIVSVILTVWPGERPAALTGSRQWVGRPDRDGEAPRWAHTGPRGVSRGS